MVKGGFLFGGLLLLVLVGSCGMLRGIHSSRVLTQSQILRMWMANSEDEIGYASDGNKKKARSADFLLVPDSVDLTLEEVDNRLRYYAGPCSQFMWRYESPDMDMKCYVNSCISPAFPVTSRGIELKITLMPRFPLEVEDIYLITDTVVQAYPTDKLAEAGWRAIGEQTFIFKIPENHTGKERLWAVECYAKNREYYDERIRWPWNVDPEALKNRRYPVANLYFIQVTDTVTNQFIYERDTRRFLRFMPNTSKWLPDPEGGYPEPWSTE